MKPKYNLDDKLFMMNASKAKNALADILDSITIAEVRVIDIRTFRLASDPPDIDLPVYKIMVINTCTTYKQGEFLDKEERSLYTSKQEIISELAELFIKTVKRLENKEK